MGARIVWMPWVSPDGHVQKIVNERVEDPESVEYDGAWLHVVGPMINLCERALVPEEKWRDRDSYDAQFQVGECWALLRAGCEYEVHGPDSDPRSDDDAIWLTTYAKGFQYHEHHEPGDAPREHTTEELHYLPTPARLERAAGEDWY